MPDIQPRRSRRHAWLFGLLIVSASAVPVTLTPSAQKPLVIDDFESGSLASWKTAGSGAGAWFVYTNGKTPPNASESDPNFPFSVPNPPQGKFAAVTDMNGPGRRILYRDVNLDGRYTLRLTLFYVNAAGFVSPETLDYESTENQQFRIDLLTPSAPLESLTAANVLTNVFRTSPGDPETREPSAITADLSKWAGQTVRLRLASVDNRGPLRVGVDDIRLEPAAR
jgi:hypothetical protein